MLTDGTLALWIILSAITYRITRLLIKDVIIERQRAWVYRKIAGKYIYLHPDKSTHTLPAFREKILELLQCYWCLSIWVACAVTATADGWYSVPLPFLYPLALSAGAMLMVEYITGS